MPEVLVKTKERTELFVNMVTYYGLLLDATWTQSE